MHPFSDDDVVGAFPEYAISVPMLGRGAFKTAYRAQNNGSDLVIKILIEPVPQEVGDLTSDALPERFARELRGMGIVDSPFVVRLLSHPSMRRIGQHAHIWYAEPYYDGGSLQDRLEEGPVNPANARSITVGLLEAVDAMWSSAKIVHRDIKPGNIVFGPAGIPVLLDLGIAYFGELTDITDGFGQSPRTPIYAAPEQFEMRRNATIDFRTDLFQIGIVGAEMLRGSHPFLTAGRADPSDYFAAMQSFTRSELEGAPGDQQFKDFIARCLAARPNGRFRTIAAAKKALGVAS